MGGAGEDALDLAQEVVLRGSARDKRRVETVEPVPTRGIGASPRSSSATTGTSGCVGDGNA